MMMWGAGAGVDGTVVIRADSVGKVTGDARFHPRPVLPPPPLLPHSTVWLSLLGIP
jgi:hypothetical protein